MGRRVLIRRQSRCLDAQTLAALAHGKMPSGELHHIEKHLPQCSRCIGAIAAGIQRRARPSRYGSTSDSAVLVRSGSSRSRLSHTLAVALSLLALGSSVTYWYLGTGAVKSRALDPWSPSSLMRGALGTAD
jgi:hypothetical protein